MHVLVECELSWTDILHKEQKSYYMYCEILIGKILNERKVIIY